LTGSPGKSHKEGGGGPWNLKPLGTFPEALALLPSLVPPGILIARPWALCQSITWPYVRLCLKGFVSPDRAFSGPGLIRAYKGTRGLIRPILRFRFSASCTERARERERESWLHRESQKNMIACERGSVRSRIAAAAETCKGL
jgi:hypothetical protein